jgi:hypothetical protein
MAAHPAMASVAAARRHSFWILMLLLPPADLTPPGDLTTLSSVADQVLPAAGRAVKAPTPPTPSTPPVQCDYALDGPTADGGVIFSNQVGDAGCISVVVQGTSLRLYAIALTPGWTYTVTSNGGGTNSRVQVEFSNPSTGQRAEARIEAGRTVIR